MSTPPATLSTPDLIAACEPFGVTVTATQLASWARAGLMPKSEHGKGRGQGGGSAPREWAWECLPRAVFIARALAGGSRSFEGAARALAIAGYAPRIDRLRAVLLDALDAAEEVLHHRQPYLRDGRPAADKRHRLRANLRRKLPFLSDERIDALSGVGTALEGVEDPTGDHGPALGAFISFAALRDALRTIGDAELLAAYEEAGRLLPRLLPPLALAVNLIALPLLRVRLRQAGKLDRLPEGTLDSAAVLRTFRQDGARLTTSPENPLGPIRLYVAILSVARRRRGEAMIGDLSPGVLTLAQQLTGVFDLAEWLRQGEIEAGQDDETAGADRTDGGTT
jgi:hypothetical protein